MAKPSRTPAPRRIPRSPLDSEPDRPIPRATDTPSVVRINPTDPIPQLRTYKPTPTTEYPTILLEGEDGAGKTWQAALLTADERVGRSFFLEWGIEGTAREYLAIPGVDYEIIDHDGTWSDIYGQVRAVRAEAIRAHRAGEKPVVLIVDTITGEWEQLKAWTNRRTRSTNRARALLERDPDAAIKTSFGMWQDTKERHRDLMRELVTMPGIVVLCARGRQVAEVDESGNPTGGTRYAVNAEKEIGHDVKVSVRMFNDAPPMITKCRSVHAGINPAVDPPRVVPDFSLSWLVFDVLKLGEDARPRHVAPVNADESGTEEAQDRAPWEAGADADVGFDPATATAQRWNQEVSTAQERGDLPYLKWLWRTAKEIEAGQEIIDGIAEAGMRATAATTDAPDQTEAEHDQGS